MASGDPKTPAQLVSHWDREANALDRQAEDRQHSQIERRLLAMHARVKRACAAELRRIVGG